MSGALGWLIVATARGRVRSLARRVRQPRYAIGFVLALLYLGSVFGSQLGRHAGKGAGVTSFMAIALLGYMALGTAWVWLSAGDRSALALSPAEGAFLLPAPIARRTLLAYKLARSVLPLLFSALFATVMFARSGGAVLTTLHGLGAFLALSIFMVHRIGVSLVRVSQEEHGTVAWRRTWLPTACFVVAAAVLGWQLRSLVALLRTRDSGWMELIRLSLEQGAARVVLAPFRVALAPMFAPSVGAWMQALPWTLLIFGLNLLWVFRSNVAFEEAAMRETSRQAERLAAYRVRGFSGLSALELKVRRTLPLAARGRRSYAFLWKNYLWLYRSGSFRTGLAIPAIALVLAVVAAPRSLKVAEILRTVLPLIAVWGLLTAPRVVRSDLRNSLGYLAVLKTLPLRGRDIVIAEIASSASFAALCEFLLIVAAVIAWSFTRQPPSAVAAATALGLALPAAVVISTVAFTIGNGLSLIFPAMSRPGSSPQGFEMMGQAMLGMLAMALAILLVFLVPILAATGLLLWLRALALGPLVAGSAFLVLLGAELVPLWNWLGHRLERLEPMDVA